MIFLCNILKKHSSLVILQYNSVFILGYLNYMLRNIVVGHAYTACDLRNGPVRMLKSLFCFQNKGISTEQ